MIAVLNRPGDRQTAALPLFQRRLPVRARPAIVAGVDETGRHVTRGLAEGPERTIVLEDPSAEQWTSAIGQAICHPGAEILSEYAYDVELVVVGQNPDTHKIVAQAQQRVDEVAQGCRLRAIVIDLAGVSECRPTPDGCLARFQLTADYFSGQLTMDQLVALAQRLLEPRVAKLLFRFAQRHRPSSTVILTAAFGWLPQVAVQQVVAASLEERLAHELGRMPAPRPITPLFHPARLVSLQQALGPRLSDAAEYAIQQYRATDPDAPLPSLESGDDGSEAALMGIVDQWCRQQCEQVQRAVTTRIRDTDSAHHVRRALRETLERIRSASEQLDTTRRRVVSRRASLERKVQSAADRRRLASRRPFLRRVFELCLWTWIVVYRLKRCFRAHNQQRSLCFERLALDQLAGELQRLEGRLAELGNHASAANHQLDQLLAPNHPCWVAMQDVASLRAVAAQLLESLTRISAELPQTSVLKQAIGAMTAPPNDTEDPWQLVSSAALELAAQHPDANQPLVDACRDILPRFRAATVDHLLHRIAQPHLPANSGESWLTAELRTSGTPLPGRIRLHWKNA